MTVINEIDIRDFAAARADGALVLDVREPYEYEAGHVPGARLVPLGALASIVGELPNDQTVHVICASGNRSRTAAQFLERYHSDVRSVVGGTSQWISAGYPVVVGTRANAA